MTTDALFNNWVTISNIRMERYKSQGYIQQEWYHRFDNMNTLDNPVIGHVAGIEGASLKDLFMISGDLVTISPWLLYRSL